MSLADLIPDEEDVAELLRSMTLETSDYWRDVLERITPKMTGVTASRWQTAEQQTRREANNVVVVQGVFSESSIARLLDQGVKPHSLKPKGQEGGAGALGTPEGPRAEADHPGIRAHMLMAESADTVRATWTVQIAEPKLRAWAKRMERNAQRRARPFPR